MLSYSPLPFWLGGEVHTGKVEPLDGALQNRKEKLSEEMLSVSQMFTLYDLIERVPPLGFHSAVMQQTPENKSSPVLTSGLSQPIISP